MGMDVMGKNPVDDTGSYFRACVWSWHPIWDYCETVAPEICAKAPEAHHNFSDGLNKKDSIALGTKVLAEIASGNTAQYLFERQDSLNQLEQNDCRHCQASGVRIWHENPKTLEKVPGIKYNIGLNENETPIYTAVKLEPNWTEILLTCNGCQGTGKTEPWAKSYSFDICHLEEFGVFLLNCGGFSIC